MIEVIDGLFHVTLEPDMIGKLSDKGALAEWPKLELNGRPVVNRQHASIRFLDGGRFVVVPTNFPAYVLTNESDMRLKSESAPAPVATYQASG